MGIDRFFNSLRKSHDITTDINPKDLNAATKALINDVDVLLIDFNAVIHTVWRDAVRKAQSEKEAEECVIVETIRYTEAITKLFPSLRHTAIFVDGVPYFGKVITQYSRRFTSELINRCKEQLLTKPRYKQTEPPKPTFFNNVKISPATKFMTNLQKRFKESGIVDYISGFDEAGEGEAKLGEYMRNLTHAKHVMVHSPDADVILLMMLEVTRRDDIQQVSIYRTNQQDKNKDHIINVSLLCDIVYSYVSSTSSDKKNVITDVVTLFTIFGNDFLPKLFNDNSPEQIKQVLASYEKIATILPDRHVIRFKPVKTIDWEFLALLMKECSSISDGLNKDFKKRPPMINDLPAAEVRLRLHMFNIEHLQRQYKFEPKASSPMGLVSDYCEGLWWVVSYYIFNDVKDYPAWYYPHHHIAPSISVLADYILEHKPKMPDFDKSVRNSVQEKGKITEYFTPLSQLVYISPNDVRGIIDVDKLTHHQLATIGSYGAKYNIHWNKILKYNASTDTFNIKELLDCHRARFLSGCSVRSLLPPPIREFIEVYGKDLHS